MIFDPLMPLIVRPKTKQAPRPHWIAALVSVLALSVAPTAAEAQAPWGGSTQLSAFVIDDRLGAALGAEWVLPLGGLESTTPSNDATQPDRNRPVQPPGPRRVHVRPWSVVFSAAAGPSIAFDPDDFGLTLLGTAALQRRFTATLRGGIGLVGALGDGRSLGAYLRGDYQGIVAIKAGWIDRAHSRGRGDDDGPFLSVALDWSVLSDSGG